MNIHRIVTGPFQTNCYIASNDQGQCLVVDPGDEAERIDTAINELDLTVIAYPTTHGHVDHVGKLAEMRRRHEAPIGMHPLDAAWAFSPENALPPWFDAPENPGTIERKYEDGQTWEDGNMPYNILFVPGHSPGSVAFYFESEGILLAGDTLFQGSIGRLDLPGGNETDMLKTLTRLMELPDDTRVLPGHGNETTIGLEKRSNMFILQYGLA